MFKKSHVLFMVSLLAFFSLFTSPIKANTIELDANNFPKGYGDYYVVLRTSKNEIRLFMSNNSQSWGISSAEYLYGNSSAFLLVGNEWVSSPSPGGFEIGTPSDTILYHNTNIYRYVRIPGAGNSYFDRSVIVFLPTPVPEVVIWKTSIIREMGATINNLGLILLPVGLVVLSMLLVVRLIRQARRYLMP